eukprot:7635179-Alexandrium_andersonii.AAC.2
MHQGTCTERRGSALRHVVHLSKSRANASPNTQQGGRAACAWQPMHGNKVGHHPALWPTCARGSNQ